MHGRILFGVVAWLLGAATATAGSVLASSLLSQGISGNAGQLLTQDAVNKALASEAAEQSQSPSADPSGARSTVRPTTHPAPSPTATSAPAPAQGATATAPSDSSSSDNASSDGSSAGGTVLTSAGGEVVASCQAAGVYLISWSPSQGYEVSGVNRGPAATASVGFESSANQITMVVSCSAGVPSATTHTGDS